MPRGPMGKERGSIKRNMPKNAILTIGPNEKNKEKTQDDDGEIKEKETKPTENTPKVNRKRGEGNQLRKPCTTVKGKRKNNDRSN